MNPRLARTAALVAVVALAAVAALGVGRAHAAGPNIYNYEYLVSDSSALSAKSSDTALVNGWGLSAGPTTPWWTSNNGTNTSTLYNGAGVKSALVVTVAGGPTGTVFNGNATAFLVSQNGVTGSGRFLFSTEAGTILGWANTVNGTNAIVAVDRSAQGAVYKGLAIANDKIYATDFHNGRVDVFDSKWQPVSGGFVDPQIPAGWAPFGIQAIGSNIAVTYAKQDNAKHDDVKGGGLGYVDLFSADGALLARVAKQGKKNAPLNAPWGLALAPESFGTFAGDLLVGNFGNGRISAYKENTPGHWVYKGQLKTANGQPIAIDGLWAIAFGNGSQAGPTSTLYVLAGPTNESHGLFGSVVVGG
jgi:uncharacterized protein (TIGR03118 family)